jgi:hypothetical protein
VVLLNSTVKILKKNLKEIGTGLSEKIHPGSFNVHIQVIRKEECTLPAAADPE